MVTMIAFGGFHGTTHKDEKDSIRLIQRAVDEGIHFMDNAWDYHDGVAEERMGKALAEGGRRDKVFLMTKICGRDRQGRPVATSKTACAGSRPTSSTCGNFTRWSTTTTPTGSSPTTAPSSTALKAIKDGKVRYLGFTGHKDPRIHLKMLSKPYDWTTRANALERHGRALPQLPAARSCPNWCGGASRPSA